MKRNGQRAKNDLYTSNSAIKSFPQQAAGVKLKLIIGQVVQIMLQKSLTVYLK